MFHLQIFDYYDDPSCRLTTMKSLRM